jgi:general secretion pathway protein K
LWTLVLIAFIAAHLMGSGRLEIQIANNLVGNAVTGAAADGAIFQTIFNLLNPRAAEGLRMFDGTPRELKIGNCYITVRVEDEAARINPNLASPAVLEALLRATGSRPESARRLALAIGEWVGSAMSERSRDALMADYRSAGLDYGPPSQPLETLDELDRVLGMTPGVFAAIRPHLSLFAPALPDMAHADPVVTATMAAVGQFNQAASESVSEQSEVFTARILVVAHGPNKAHVSRTAVVRIAPKAGAYVILAWDDDTD